MPVTDHGFEFLMASAIRKDCVKVNSFEIENAYALPCGLNCCFNIQIMSLSLNCRKSYPDYTGEDGSNENAGEDDEEVQPNVLEESGYQLVLPSGMSFIVFPSLIFSASLLCLILSLASSFVWFRRSFQLRIFKT